MSNTIPPITEPLGKHWQQPDPDGFLIDDTHAVMSQSDCNKLATYSTSQPTGAYTGKCWKSEYPLGSEVYYLKWFSDADDPNYLVTNRRRILIVV